ncbi:MAG TPA: antitoxin Xre/MbcA/ParS toxin-binding domain-containing protein [Gemmatimonadaceae bacterium]|nr:antitoxin Xre/MbcA/ParS toxin-binding domain-containing protein [Gemmatimonadaceae bacterium]
MPEVAERKAADVGELWSQLAEHHREGHYYVALLGMRRYEVTYVVSQIERGFGYQVFERFQKNAGLPVSALARLIEIPERTLARRRSAGRLEPDESDRLARAARVFARAIELFEGSMSQAREWLLTPLRALGGQAPLDFARTDAGAIEVEHLIGRLEHGLPT